MSKPFSLVIGCGLMALMFYSSRHGYDDIDRRDLWSSMPRCPSWESSSLAVLSSWPTKLRIGAMA